MVWLGKGRSGIGDSSTGCWEDWGGLSPNGRQYKNELTREVRDLSGAEYWGLRKEKCPRTATKYGQEPSKYDLDIDTTVFPRSELYTPNGKANIRLFAKLDETKDALARLWKASKQKRIDIDTLDELCELLHKHSMDISPDDYEHLHYQLESKRHASFMASLSPHERDEVEKEERLEYVKANADKFPMLALSLGIQPSPQTIRQMEREGFLAPSRRLANVDWWELLKGIGAWLLLALVAWKIFSI